MCALSLFSIDLFVSLPGLCCVSRLLESMRRDGDDYH